MTAPLVDLAYGQVTCGDAVVDVSAMLEEIDCVPRRSAARPALAQVAAAQQVGRPMPCPVALPTVWGPIRTAEAVAELRAVGVEPAPIPRAVAVAASHADAAATTVVVVETALLPATGGHWCAHEVVRRDGHWMLGAGSVSAPRAVPVESAWAQLVDRADAVFVDGPDAASVAQAIGVLSTAFGVRACPVDRAILVAFGGKIRPTTAVDLLNGVPSPPASARPRSARAPAAVAAMLLVAAAVLAAWTHWPRATPADQLEVTVGDASLSVPGSWVRSEQTAAATGARAVFAAPDDGRRLIVVVSRLREGSTPDTVAESLRNRIAQRGDDAVAEFSTDLSYAGRRVIGYRENPASGAPVAWYVSVDGRMQVSIGCQAGTGSVSVDDACRTAVGTVRVAD